MSWSRIVGNIGRVLIGSGALILLFVVYQLWGTSIHEQRAQNSLRSEFEIALVVSPEFGPPPPPAEDGDAIAQIRIPRIGITKTVVEGVTADALKDGPGHYPGTPLPGQAGNAAIAGHRTTYGHPFLKLDELGENDLIYVTTLQGSFVYRVSETLIVSPKDVFVLDASQDNRLTLTTCHPRYSARKRLIIMAVLIGEPAESGDDQRDPPVEVTLASEDFETTATTTRSLDPEDLDLEESDPDVAVVAAVTTTTATPASIQEGGLISATPLSIDGEAGNRWPAILLGLLASAIAFVIWYIAQRWRQWPTYALGAPVFLVSLFFFFEAFYALLPPGV